MTFNRTDWNWNKSNQKTTSHSLKLLIEPIGIETNLRYKWTHSRHYLLIEPIGIETRQELLKVTSVWTFNRTDWNWNTVLWYLYRDTLLLLIEPIGIETRFSHAHRCRRRNLLIEPIGIETWNVDIDIPMITLLLIEPIGIETRIILPKTYAPINF